MATLQLAIANKHSKSPTTPTYTDTHSKSHQRPFDFSATFLIPHRRQNPASWLPKPSFIVAKPSLIVAKTQPHCPHLTVADPLRSPQLITVQLASHSRRFSPSHYLRRFRRRFNPSSDASIYSSVFFFFYRWDWLFYQVSFKRRIVESDLFVGIGFFVKFWFIVDVWIHFYI